MIQRFHGIDQHKRFSTISVLNREGKEIEFISMCSDLRAYIETLGPEDAVIEEASTGAFHWADQVEAKEALCFILDPHKFKIIKESWNKTDKRDARNMSKALWVHLITGEFGIPVVFKPTIMIRELRKLFSEYALLKKQITMHKNNVQAILAENGVLLRNKEKNALLSEKYGLSMLNRLELSGASRISIQVSLELLWKIEAAKERISGEILLTGEPLQEKVKLLITIRGISPLTALSFLSDVGDIHRFKTLRKMNAYLGLVPKSKDSGGKSRPGHINRESRKLTRTILTQSLVQVTDASPHFRLYYDKLKLRRGPGRARIALIRKLCGIMRHMLLNEEGFRYTQSILFDNKLKEYERGLDKIKREKKTA
jgi:transposase